MCFGSGLMHKQYNVGIVGLGHVARHQIAALRRSRRFKLIAGCDTDPAQFRLLDASVQCFYSLDEMLRLDELDVVVIASPNRLHVGHGIQAMEARKWVVMEKPLAETREGFERFREQRARLHGRCTLALHAAYGVEMDWFCSSVANAIPECRQVESFACRFYDPYVKDGLLLQAGRSLGGSWTDSSINALSVIGRLLDVSSLQIIDSRMTRVANSGCREVQGTVDFNFVAKGTRGEGSIDTNWSIGRDRKTTDISFADGGGRYLLDHSAQQVVRLVGESREVLYAPDNDLPRLTNHYIGVFADLAIQLERKQDNFAYCESLHNLLYQAEEWHDAHLY